MPEELYLSQENIERNKQLKNKANFLGKDGKLFLVRCMMCPDAGERGRENYAMNVAAGLCAWCGWGSRLQNDTD